MKIYFASFIVLFISVVAYSQDKPQGLNVQDTAPMFSAKDQSGKDVSLKSLLKNGTVNSSPS